MLRTCWPDASPLLGQSLLQFIGGLFVEVEPSHYYIVFLVIILEEVVQIIVVEVNVRAMAKQLLAYLSASADGLLVDVDSIYCPVRKALIDEDAGCEQSQVAVSCSDVKNSNVVFPAGPQIADDDSVCENVSHGLPLGYGVWLILIRIDCSGEEPTIDLSIGLNLLGVLYQIVLLQHLHQL